MFLDVPQESAGSRETCAYVRCHRPNHPLNYPQSGTHGLVARAVLLCERNPDHYSLARCSH